MTLEFQSALRIAYRLGGMRAAWALAQAHYDTESPIDCPACEGQGQWLEQSFEQVLVRHCAQCGGEGRLLFVEHQDNA